MRYRDAGVITVGQLVDELFRVYQPNIQASLGSDAALALNLVGGAALLGLGAWEEKVPRDWGTLLMTLGSGLLSLGIAQGIQRLTPTSETVRAAYTVTRPAAVRKTVAPSPAAGRYTVVG